MSQNTAVPLYYDGQDRRTPPVSIQTHSEIKKQRKAGELHGWYVDNGNTFIVYQPRRVEAESIDFSAGSGFDSAWHISQSGWAGPLVWQLRPQRCVS